MIEPFSGGAGFYSSVFVFPKHNAGFWPIHNLKHFMIICISLLLRCLLKDMYSNLFNMVIMLSPSIPRVLILHIPIVKHHHCFFMICLVKICCISGKVYLLGWPQSLGYSQPSLNQSCSFSITRVSILLPI